ncbi:hypothetical protein DFQ30_004192 [Apophysomyces sp. BC1015]|nr:hypothetical protein DFQ30_004192 [Apophysomyces sp. BC1015]
MVPFRHPQHQFERPLGSLLSIDAASKAIDKQDGQSSTELCKLALVNLVWISFSTPSTSLADSLQTTHLSTVHGSARERKQTIHKADGTATVSASAALAAAAVPKRAAVARPIVHDSLREPNTSLRRKSHAAQKPATMSPIPTTGTVYTHTPPVWRVSLSTTNHLLHRYYLLLLSSHK